jgi:hypothetical protein
MAIPGLRQIDVWLLAQYHSLSRDESYSSVSQCPKMCDNKDFRDNPSFQRPFAVAI